MHQGRKRGTRRGILRRMVETNSVDKRRRQVPAFQQARARFGVVKAEDFLFRFAVGNAAFQGRRRTWMNSARW